MEKWLEPSCRTWNVIKLCSWQCFHLKPFRVPNTHFKNQMNIKWGGWISQKDRSVLWWSGYGTNARILRSCVWMPANAKRVFFAWKIAWLVAARACGYPVGSLPVLIFFFAIYFQQEFGILENLIKWRALPSMPLSTVGSRNRQWRGFWIGNEGLFWGSEIRAIFELV